MSVIPADTSYGGFHMPPPAFQYAQGSPSNMHPLMTGRNLSDSWAPSPGSSSDYSSCSEDSALSPATPSNEPTSSLFADPAGESQETWDLIPYNVPWGHEYCDYRPGVLPGPDGACIFLRSPTPLKNKRTVKACNKCRGRKAKVSPPVLYEVWPNASTSSAVARDLRARVVCRAAIFVSTTRTTRKTIEGLTSPENAHEARQLRRTPRPYIATRQGPCPLQQR